MTRKDSTFETMKWLAAISFTLLLVACGNFGLNEEQLLQRAKAYLEDEQYQAAAIEACLLYTSDAADECPAV